MCNITAWASRPASCEAYTDVVSELLQPRDNIVPPFHDCTFYAEGPLCKRGHRPSAYLIGLYTVWHRCAVPLLSKSHWSVIIDALKYSGTHCGSVTWIPHIEWNSGWGPVLMTWEEAVWRRCFPHVSVHHCSCPVSVRDESSHCSTKYEIHSMLQLHGWISFMKEKNKDSFNRDPISINLIMFF